MLHMRTSGPGTKGECPLRATLRQESRDLRTKGLRRDFGYRRRSTADNTYGTCGQSSVTELNTILRQQWARTPGRGISDASNRQVMATQFRYNSPNWEDPCCTGVCRGGFI